MVQTLELIVVIREKKLGNTNLVASRHIYGEKASLPVDVGRVSNSVFERRTSTGSEIFASLGSGLVQNLG